ncbi:hypothetical protein A7X89_02205 [Stenotrophomonas maltophilia]|nr:hypothetical protein A7X89_02205 [Stenotrophomonas maltophilia]
MSTDKTLADVQPGGRVRLGDQAERAQFEEWYVQNAFDYEANPIGSRDCALMRKAWNAALSAQPSPGGQGGLNYERMFVDACAALAEVSRELGCDPEQGGAEPILAAIAELREALAARQPVGEPVALGETDPIPCAWSDDDASSLVTLRDALRRIIAGTTTKDAAHFLKQPGQRRMTIKDAQETAAAHLPYVESLVHRSQGYAAQAVDLGELRRLSDGWLARSEKLSVTQQRKAGAYWACAKELRDWLDSQAVGK